MTEELKVMLAFPGPTLSWAAAVGVFRPSIRHRVTLAQAGGSWDNFNTLWAAALNAFEAGEITHFAMIHSDVEPHDPVEPGEPRWLDILMEELAARDADLISAVIPIKSIEGVTSTGLGDVDDPWGALRRLTIREMLAPDFPETFDADDLCHLWNLDGYLIHNNGLWLADLRRPAFHKTNADGDLVAYFYFRRRVTRDRDGRWRVLGESEDWFFSRMLWQLDAKTCATRKVKLEHRGSMTYPTDAPWGVFFEGDAGSADRWRARAAARGERSAALATQ